MSDPENDGPSPLGRRALLGTMGAAAATLAIPAVAAAKPVATPTTSPTATATTTAAAAAATTGGVSLTADNTWTGTQRFTSAFGGSQTTATGTYPTSGGGNPGIEFANGTTNWRVDNQAGTLRFLQAGIKSVVTFDFAGNIKTPGSVTCSAAGIGSETTPRHPVPMLITMDGSTFSAATPKADKVAHALTVTFKGGFSGESGRGLDNPGWLWGANDFITTGTASGDLSGIQDLQSRLTEVHCAAPGATLNTLTGQQVEANVDATATGATVVDAHALRVIGTRVNSGTVTNAYGLLVTQPTTSGSGTITGTKKALFVGGDTQLDGNVMMSSLPTSNSAAGGGAAVLPPAPAGYATINIGGIDRKFPFYA